MYEQLETRRMLAVTTQFAEGVLRVIGDSEGNRVAIVRNTTSGNLLVRTGDTTIREVAYAQVQRIVVELAGGHDRIETGQNVEKPMTISGGEGNDSLYGGGGADSINGGLGNDLLSGGFGKDSLYGSDGDDRIDGGPGGDLISGGGGIDAVNYESRTAGVRVTLDNIANDGTPPNSELPNGEGDNVRTDIERIAGGRGNDFLSAAPTVNSSGETITPGRVTIEGGLGNDTIVGSSGGEVGTIPNSVLSGGEGNDSITGGSKNDSINGGNGNDILRGIDGNDTVNGGFGADYLSGGGGLFDVVTYADRTTGVNISLDNVANDGFPPNAERPEGEGDNALSDFERIVGGKGSDSIVGSAGNNTISGGEGNDTIRGGGGNDVIEGGQGNDDIYGDGGNDSLYAGLGNDRLFGGEGNDLLSAKDGLKDLLDGGTGLEDRAWFDSGLDEVQNLEIVVT